jgi:hypothetical protein
MPHARAVPTSSRGTLRKTTNGGGRLLNKETVGGGIEPLKHG